MPLQFPVPCRTFLFDLDGTLIDSKADIALAVNLTLKHWQIPAVDEGQIAGFVGDGVQMLIRRVLQHSLGGEPDISLIQGAVERYLKEYEAHLLDSTHLCEGVLEGLSGLSWATFAVITNKPERFSRRILQGLQIDKRFSLILGGDSTSARKPSPGPLLEAMSRCSARPAETAMIGDSSVDILAGKAAGVITCGITGGFRGREELKSAGCDLVIENLRELPRYFCRPQ
jgi:phosphoglycolate phosphatase